MKKIQQLLIAFLFILSFHLNGFAQQSAKIDYYDDPVLPKGKKGEVVQKLLNIINSNDENKVEAFIENSFTAKFQNKIALAVQQNKFSTIFKQTGGLSFHSIRSYNPPRDHETFVILKDENFKSWRAIVINFDNKKENLIDGFRFSDAWAPLNIEKEPKITELELIKKSEELVKRICEKDIFSGAVLIAKGNQILFEETCGEASKRFHVLNKIDTKFNLGSMNKMFTATAIMQLVEKKKLNVEDHISKYIDESWLPKAITNKITIHHLLTHTSGLGSYLNADFWKGSRELFRTIDDFKPLVKGDTLAFRPGERYKYSNNGMLLLGVIIQNVTGGNYFDYIREHIYKPIGMINTDSYEMSQPVENLAIGYISVPNNNFGWTPNNEYGWENNIYKLPIKGGPAGGGFSTVRDLHKFATALVTGELVSESSLNLLWTDHSKSGYGYGFGIKKSSKGKIVGHNGGFPGLNSSLDIFLDQGYIIVVMSNYDQGASPVVRHIKNLVLRLKD